MFLRDTQAAIRSTGPLTACGKGGFRQRGRTSRGSQHRDGCTCGPAFLALFDAMAVPGMVAFGPSGTRSVEIQFRYTAIIRLDKGQSVKEIR